MKVSNHTTTTLSFLNTYFDQLLEALFLNTARNFFCRVLSAVRLILCFYTSSVLTRRRIISILIYLRGLRVSRESYFTQTDRIKAGVSEAELLCYDLSGRARPPSAVQSSYTVRCTRASAIKHLS